MELAANHGIFGRESELSVLADLVAQVAAGRGGVGWLEGEPGIGKSALIDAMTAGASAAGCRVLRGAGDELMQAFPLRLMAECLGVSPQSPGPAQAEIARLLRGEAGLSVTLDPVLAAGERMIDLVDRLCAADPVVLVVEDLHWADEPSLLLWNRLARSIGQIPLLLLGTCRPVPRRPTVARLRVVVRERSGAYIKLGPLGQAEVVRMASRLVSGEPGPRLSAELARAGGNPLYVRELAEALLRDGSVEAFGQVAELRTDVHTRPSSLTAAIRCRLGFLSDDTAQALRMAALLGHQFELGHWAEVAGRSMSALATVVDEAVSAGVITEVGRRLTFRHDVIRQVLAEHVPWVVRAGLHRQAAKVLAHAGAGVDEVARQLLAAPQDFEEWALAWLAGLPEPMLYAAPDVAAELLTRAVQASRVETAHRDVLAARLAYVLFWLGRDEQAGRFAERVLQRTADAELAGRLRILVLRSAGRMRRFEQALAVAEPALADDTMPAMWRARLAAWSAMILAYLGRLDEAGRRAQEALDDARRCADSLGVAYAHNTLAFISPPPAQIGHMDAALAELGDDAESTDLRMLLLGNRLHRLLVSGRRAQVEAALADALVTAERVGTIRSGILLAQATSACYQYGRWDDAIVFADSVNPEFKDNPALAYLHAIVAIVAMHREDGELAEARLRTAGFIGMPGEPWAASSFGSVTLAQAMWAESRGDLDRALAIRATWLELPSGPIRDARCDEVLYLVRLALALGDLDTARAAAAAVVPEDDSSPDRVLAARCCRAILDGDTAELSAAAEEYRRHGWPQHVGFALEESAELLARAGDMSAARAAFNEAVGVYTELGATWDIRRAEARLRPYGIRRGPRAVRRRATHGWEALTPSELRIAHLVAKGRANPDIAAELFLSRNTVQTHVSRVLVKLHMRSRVELIHEFANRSRTPPR